MNKLSEHRLKAVMISHRGFVKITKHLKTTKPNPLFPTHVLTALLEKAEHARAEAEEELESIFKELYPDINVNNL